MKKLILLLITHYSLFIASCFAQVSNAHNYLPQYNLWLPGSHSYNQNQIIYPYGRRPVMDSLFYWQYVNVPAGFGPEDIFFIDSLYGWGMCCDGILRTTDSGFNWDTTQFIVGECLHSVHFVNRSTGWIVGGNNMIRKTMNGGINWIIQDPPDSSGYSPIFFNVHFFDQNTGIVAGARSYSQGHSYIIRTSDSGNNWNEIYVTSGNDNLYRQFWLNDDTGWMCGSDILLKTTDGGLNYTNYYSNVPPTQNGSNGLLDLYFINENTGWICGGNLDHKNIYKTTNAGINWIFQDNPVAYYEYPQINGIIFINADTGWASSYVGLIIVTTNSGANWIINQVVNEETWKFSKYSNSKIWCTGFWHIWYTVLNSPIGITPASKSVPENFELDQNYPNPFNPVTKINFSVPAVNEYKKSKIKLIIYNVLGKEISKIVDNTFSPGTYETKWDGSNFPSGIYFYCLLTEKKIISKKMILLK